MKLRYVIFISSIYAAASAHAEDFYALGAIGHSHFEGRKSIADDALSGNGVAGTASSFNDNDIGYKLQLGYQFNQNFAIEGGYVDLGQQNYRVDLSDGNGKAKVDERGWNIDALGIVPINTGFSLFGKLGAIDARTHYHVAGLDAGSEFVESHDKYKWSPNFGVGGNYAVNDNTAVRLELERFADLGKKNTTGEQNVDLVALGVSYRFN